MNTTHALSFLSKTAGILGLVVLCGCAELNDPYYGRGYGGYDDGYYHGRDDYYDRDYDRARRERERLERERERAEDERRRLEQERNRYSVYSPPARSNPSQDRCPPGFSPSENKCSPEERRRGCKDIRLPSGLGCVHR